MKFKYAIIRKKTPKKLMHQTNNEKIYWSFYLVTEQFWRSSHQTLNTYKKILSEFQTYNLLYKKNYSNHFMKIDSPSKKTVNLQ